MNRFANLIIDPSNFWSLFHPQNKFMIFKLLTVYKKISIDELLMTQIAGRNSIIKKVSKELEKRDLVNYIDTTEIIRKNSGKYEEWFQNIWKLILAFIASISVIGIVTAVLRSCDIEIVAADFSSIALVLGAIFLLLGGIMVYGGVVSLGIFVMLLGLALVVLAIATYGAESY